MYSGVCSVRPGPLASGAVLCNLASLWRDGAQCLPCSNSRRCNNDAGILGKNPSSEECVTDILPVSCTGWAVWRFLSPFLPGSCSMLLVGACPARGSAFISSPTPPETPRFQVVLAWVQVPRGSALGPTDVMETPQPRPSPGNKRGELSRSQTNRYFLSVPGCQRSLPPWEFREAPHPARVSLLPST